ncbi:ferritin-like domain-containing protein [Chitiniphilus eburneus]|uniref:ferritin-like domain-containing protein n=1 Tax=Chitiniphilus eburneus TaxID=2571148 RepID=UPI001FE9B233|nr:ferritin-like domain-containing protein [Chitiniphilus eburneus]
MTTPHDLRGGAFMALCEMQPELKVMAVDALNDSLPIMPTIAAVRLPVPGRPARPELVAPHALIQRNLSTPAGRAALLHAIAHIEFNAINLALDAIYRFDDMPLAYYRDWVQVAREEALHFTLVVAQLARYGYGYGDFPAHNGLWDMALRTDHDVMARMALVPRILEARGLDVTPGIRAKLAQQGDTAACEVLDVILRDEIGHVRIGNRWYRHCCEARGLDPVATFVQLLRDTATPTFKGPLNHAARREAGFTDEELLLIASLND